MWDKFRCSMIFTIKLTCYFFIRHSSFNYDHWDLDNKSNMNWYNVYMVNQHGTKLPDLLHVEIYHQLSKTAREEDFWLYCQGQHKNLHKMKVVTAVTNASQWANQDFMSVFHTGLMLLQLVDIHTVDGALAWTNNIVTAVWSINSPGQSSSIGTHCQVDTSSLNKTLVILIPLTDKHMLHNL